MKKYCGSAYEKVVDCFAKTKDVKSILLYGDPEAVRNPCLTVMIPTYKRVVLFKQALNSVLSQWHTDFFWNIVVVDNEPYDGTQNETEKLIREIDNERIAYYRNTENMRPGDNFNRGILLAKGQWVAMLHDDDFLISNTLQTLGKLISGYEKRSKRPLGAIAAGYHQVEYNPTKDVIKADVVGINNYFSWKPIERRLYRLTHNNILLTGHIGGSVPTNGTTFYRKAVLEVGGFNDDFGISADLILFYCLENRYTVYSTIVPLGFYRWGSNTMIKLESTYNTIKAGYDFREYVYSKSWAHRLIGRAMRNCHYKKFTVDVIKEKRNVSKEKIALNDFDAIYDERPSTFSYWVYIHVVLRLHSLYKRLESRLRAPKKLD